MRSPMTPLWGKHARTLVGLALVLLVGVIACEQKQPRISVPTPTPATSLNKAFPRNHVPQSGYWKLVYVTFTSETTYEQAERILHEKGMYHYPMVNGVPCGNVREIEALPPPPEGSPCPVGTVMLTVSLQADFRESHRMLVVTDSWEKLNRIATESRVVSVDPYPAGAG